MLSQITPVLLTYNEAPNIERTLARLAWARDVVVVDSGSTDATLSIVGKFANVRVLVRPFDSHANQWRFAVSQTNIATSWLLRLDADYRLSDEIIEEIAGLDPDPAVNAYRIGFDYAVCGERLRTSLYPPNTILLRRGHFAVRDAGHTESWTVEGRVVDLRGRILHDDRKSVEFWLTSQGRYMRRELAVLENSRAGWKTWLRLRPPLAPILAFLYCLFGKGLILDGRAGLFYALQRMVAEAALSLMVLEARLRPRIDVDEQG